jgi:hypothetical protein
MIGSKLITRNELPNLSQLFGNNGNSRNSPLPNDLFIKGVPKAVHSNVSVVNGGGVGVIVMHSFTLPAQSLRKDGDFINGVVAGTFDNSNDNNKGFLLTIDGQVFGGTGSIDIDGNNSGWVLFFELMRLSSTSVIAISHMVFNAGYIDSAAVPTSLAAGSVSQGRTITLTGLANLNSNNIIIQSAGNGGMSANDIVQRYSRFYLTRM